MPASDRIRAVPRQWWVIGGSLAVVLLFVSLVSCVGSDSVATEGEAPSTTPTPVTSTDAPQPSERSTNAPSTSQRSSTSVTASTIDLAGEYGIDVEDDDPAVVARPIPEEPTDSTPPTTLVPPPWAASTRTTAGGYLGVDVGCAESTSYQSLDRFFAARVGPALGWDYQHVYPLGGDRYLWLFQDTFIDHTGVVSNLGKARFVHNAALLQTGRCFTLLHRGSTAKPEPFELGDGTGNVRDQVVLADGRRAVGRQPAACSGPRWSRIRTTRTRPTAWAGTRASSTWRPTTRRRSRVWRSCPPRIPR